MKFISIIRASTAYLLLIAHKISGVNVKFSTRNHFGKRVSLYLDKGAQVVLGNDIGLRDNVCLSARSGSELVLGNNVFLNNGCQVIAHEKIILGDNVRCGQNTMFFDHDYDYRGIGGCSSKQYNCSPIMIGEGTWIGAGCIILRGTTVGKNCVIGAGTVLKGKVPDNTVVVQKRDNKMTELH